jgi:hypothetical protein
MRIIPVLVLLLAIPAHAATYSGEVQWTEPTTSMDGSALTDLGRYDLEVHVDGQGAIQTATIPAPSASPAQGSTLQHAFPVLPLTGGERVFVLARACDNATHPQTGAPFANCSDWAQSDTVVVPDVDLTAPSGATEITISITVTVP